MFGRKKAEKDYSKICFFNTETVKRYNFYLSDNTFYTTERPDEQELAAIERIKKATKENVAGLGDIT